MARHALKDIETSHIKTLAALGNPPAKLMLVAKALLIIMKGELKNHEWKNFQALAKDAKTLFNNMFNFDPSTMIAKQVDALRPVLQNPEFEPSKMKPVSSVGTGICAWVINCVICYDLLHGHPIGQ